MHVLIANKQFLLFIDVPIRIDHNNFQSTKFFTLDIPHGNCTACYNIHTQYLGITQDKTMAVKIMPQQFRVCQEANGQFCNIPTPFQPIANPPSCIKALHTKNTVSISISSSLQIRKTSDVSMPSQLTPNVWILTTAPASVPTKIILICPGETTQFIEVRKPIHVPQLPRPCSATSPNFHIPICYENQTLEVNVSLDMVNLNSYEFSNMAALGATLE